jgi:hypothetical protein
VLDHTQAQWRQVEHLPGLDPGHRGAGQLLAVAAAPIRDMPGKLVRLGDLGQMGAGRAVLLAQAGAARPGRQPAAAPARACPGSLKDGGRCEFEESLPSRRSSSTIRVCSVAISRACSALDARNSAMTAA